MLNHLPRCVLVIVFDLCMVAFAWFGSYLLRYDGILNDNLVWISSFNLFPLILMLQSISYWIFGLYRGIWRFASLPDLIRIIKAVAFGCGAILFVLFGLTRLEGVPRSIVPLYGMLLVFFLGGSRFTIRYLKDGMRLFGERVLIIGANQAAEVLVRSLLKEKKGVGIPVGFIDDRVQQQGQEIHGVRVVGRYSEITTVIKKLKVDLIIISLPGITAKEMQRVVQMAERTSLPVRILPSVGELVCGKVTLNNLRKISLDDLLGREELSIDWGSISKEIENKTILITGAGGSVGSELCRQVAKLNPAVLVMVDHSEYNLFDIKQEFLEKFTDVEIRCHLINVIDESGIRYVMTKYRPNIVLHAAAYKHVSMLEEQIREAVLNNIVGTRCLVKAALLYNVGKFILVSTDKAVNPANIMGATKRIAEMFCQKSNHGTSIKFIVVRFGNVLGSAGSVVPIFQRQLEKGGPLTVTDPNVKRYFMSISEAAQLILQALSLGDGGETFVLNMGEPISIKFLAEQMIRLSGKKIEEDIKIEYTGLQQGEKLYEELFFEHEKLLATSHCKLKKVSAFKSDWGKIDVLMEHLILACKNCNYDLLRNIVEELLNVGCSSQEKVKKEAETC